MLAEGKPEEGLLNLEKAVKEDPGNVQFRSDLLTRRAEQITRMLSAAESERAAGRLDNSEALYRRVLKIEPANSRAVAGMETISRYRRYPAIIEQAKAASKNGELELAQTMLKPVLTENPAYAEAVMLSREIIEQQLKNQNAEPILQSAEKRPVNLEFRDANVKYVFEALARSSGVSFILDKDVSPDLRTTVFLQQATLEDAIALILQTNRLEKKVLNRSTILIYPNTPEKLKEYQELIVKGFYLANADVKQTQAMLKSLLKTKDMFVEEKLNLLIVRDTPEAIRLAEKLIAMHDLSEPEVMLEVEVLEVKRSRLLELGIQWPNQLTLTPLGATGSATTLSDLKNLNATRVSAALPSTVINLRRDVGDANILANPRIRARNREKAKIMIGDKVPVSTSTTTATGIVSESIQYLDVGIKLDVEPNIYLQEEVAIKVGLEVSSIVSQVRTPGGSLSYQIGSRSVSTVLRLKDGETQVLAGLISDEDRTDANRVPGLGDLPILGRLFSSQKDDRQKTEIVLSITPHLIRNINRPNAATSEFWSGTESSLRTQPLTLKTAATGNEASGGAMVRGSGSRLAQPNPNVAPAPIVLSWQGPSQVKVGEEFKLALRMKTDGGLRSWPFQLSFDPALFQVVDIAGDPLFKTNDAKSNITSSVDANVGRVFLNLTGPGENGAKGDEGIATVTLKALAAKQQADIKWLSFTPVTVGERTVEPVLPSPFVIDITN